jgi:hypothetical protein
MADGRNFTDYSSRCTYAAAWRQPGAAPQSSNAARKYMIANASEIMSDNAVRAARLNNCGTCYGLSEAGTMLPELEMTVCDKRTCTFPQSDSYGLGMGRAAA